MTGDITAADGVSLRVRVDGDQTGHPVVLVHGYTGGSVDWEPIAPDLGLDYTVVSYDHRGHGASGRGAAELYTITQLVADLRVVVDWARVEFDATHVHLVGHSLGGVVAMRYVTVHQDTVASLVLMDTAGSGEFDVPEQIAEIAAVGRVSGMDVVAQLVVGFLRDQDGAPTLDDAATERMVAKLAATDVEALDALARELRTFPPVTGLGALTIPTTVVVGELDTTLRAPAERLAAAISAAELVVIPRAGHSPQEDEPEVALAALRHHLGRVPAT